MTEKAAKKEEDASALKEKLSSLPAVDKLLLHPKVEDLADKYSKKAVKRAVREAISITRERLLSDDEEVEISEPSMISLIEDWLLVSHKTALRPVINATGIVLHTNLGRAPLGRDVLENVIRIAGGYSNLEFDLEKGERGSRYDHIAKLINEITTAESSIIVNNNAAAVLLVANTLANGKEVIVSRGELVEIGGAFRIPDVIEKSGAMLKEVGTTNRTRLSDYESAIGPETGMILKVHTSNYKIVGFTEDVPASDLVKLANKQKIPVMEDLGSGCLVDLSRFGLPREPTVIETVKSGVDVVTFSGDKLLGGGQAGFILGKEDTIKKVRQNPLNRALRIDKFTLAAAEATLLMYRDVEVALKKIPALSMITMPYDKTQMRVKRIVRKINSVPHPGFDVVSADDFSQPGGGSFPTADIPTRVVLIFPIEIGPEKLEERMRAQDPPIIARIAQERVIIDPRTITESDIPNLTDGILKAMEAI
ncbi:MAG: L-seryl-tRNA(Sec) selenium transferase [Deltaproteobacteria bacterium]|uniref:L-seryl-tRNA(Sec) selenium transferase n=1 Tax=Candidatus Zymogenus saltonus TaxID=2844893 RepID=A0A9D8KES5_9DELT|nr:L-seryl-tRNA(Sec) selenium transferase [Candidatus Zymogenus saltonus]